MSYILEALKKAETERQKGLVPTIHAHAATTLPEQLHTGYRSKLWALVAAILAIGVTGTFFWFKPWQQALPSPATQQEMATQAAFTKSETKPEAATAAISAPLSSAPAASSSMPQIVAVSPVPEKLQQPAPAVSKTRKTSAVGDKEPKENNSKQTAEIGPKTVTAAASASQAAKQTADLKLSTNLSTELTALSLRDLPEQIQRELPNINIGGYIYSENQRERQLLVNRRLLREGEEAAPGVILEQMLPKAAVFNYKGYRYRMPY